MTETTRMIGFSAFSAEVLVSAEERQCCIRKRALCDDNWVALSGDMCVSCLCTFLYTLSQ